MKKGRLCVTVAGLVMEASVHAGPPFTLPDEDSRGAG
jgi:hypothetical protein